jgi:hypothetical protein
MPHMLSITINAHIHGQISMQFSTTWRGARGDADHVSTAGMQLHVSTAGMQLHVSTAGMQLHVVVVVVRSEETNECMHYIPWGP